MIDLRGRCALVTGGSRGIGAATALMLARCGADVAIGFRSRAADAERVAEQARALGVRASAHAADIASAAGADALVAAAVDSLGALDLFVGNAGVWPSAEEAVVDLPDERWRRTMAENVDGMFYSTRAALRAMRDGGRIVLVSSTAGQRGEAMHADYGASKGAMIAFVKSLALEVSGRGITVNSVAPGWVDTEMTVSAMGDGGRERIARAIPVGRVATPDDIAFPIVCLCADGARHVTGEIVNVNGGSVLCG